jgi:hypothetical protein
VNPSGEDIPSGETDKTNKTPSRNPETGKSLLIEEGYQIFWVFGFCDSLNIVTTQPGKK